MKHKYLVTHSNNFLNAESQNHRLKLLIFLQHLLVLLASCPVKTSAEDRDDLQNILGKLLLKGAILVLVDNNNFDVFNLADRKNKLGAKAQQPILVRDDKTLNISSHQFIEQANQAFLVVVHSGPEVAHQLIGLAVLCAKQLQHLLLTDQILLLV